MDRQEDPLEVLVATRGRSLLTYAFLLCNNEADAADLVQDALVTVFSRRARRLPEVNHLEAFVKKTILNAYIDSCRRATRWRKLRELLGRTEPTTTAAEDELLATDELDRALASLSPQQRLSFGLRYHEELSIDEIARQLNARPGTVKRHLSDARARLAPRFEATKDGTHHA